MKEATDTDTELSQRERVAELFAALLKAPRTVRELAEMTGLGSGAAEAWVKAMQASGLIHPDGHRQGRAGPPARVYALNPYPFMAREPAHTGPVKRVYVAGPMSGLKDLNFPAFHQAARELRAAGLEVVNPAEINVDPAAGWAACLRADVRELVTCDTVALLPGWERSRGALLEARLGRELGLRVQPLGELVAALGGDRAAAYAATRGL